jgi:Arc/MetJ-type ribon-helix-helix transcriptional regulator
MNRTQVQLTEEQIRQLKIIASERNVSMSELVRNCVDQWLASRKGASITERLQRAMAIAGRFRSGDKQANVSTEHDQYLSEIFSS